MPDTNVIPLFLFDILILENTGLCDFRPKKIGGGSGGPPPGIFFTF